MRIEYDLSKDHWNINNRNISFEQAKDLDWDTAHIIEDVRKDYPEHRFIATGYLYGRLHVVCFTPINDGIRVISFRKANIREVKKYEQTTINR